MSCDPEVLALHAELQVQAAALRRADARVAALLQTNAALRERAAATQLDASAAALHDASARGVASAALGDASSRLAVLVAENETLQSLVYNCQRRLALAAEHGATLAAGVSARNDLLSASEARHSEVLREADELRALAGDLAEELDAERARGRDASAALAASAAREAALAARLADAVSSAASAASGASSAIREVVAARAATDSLAAELAAARLCAADERAAATVSASAAAAALAASLASAHDYSERSAVATLVAHMMPVSNDPRGTLGPAGVAIASTRGLRLLSPAGRADRAADAAPQSAWAPLSVLGGKWDSTGGDGGVSATSSKRPWSPGASAVTRITVAAPLGASTLSSAATGEERGTCSASTLHFGGNGSMWRGGASLEAPAASKTSVSSIADANGTKTLARVELLPAVDIPDRLSLTRAALLHTQLELAQARGSAAALSSSLHERSAPHSARQAATRGSASSGVFSFTPPTHPRDASASASSDADLLDGEVLQPALDSSRVNERD